MHDHQIGDANIERLLEAAYQPEPMDAAFAKNRRANGGRRCGRRKRRGSRTLTG